MSAKTTRVPETLADDAADVVEALDIARMLFEKGDRVEAARFVRRASDAAQTASRLIALARAADEIEASSEAPPATSETRLSKPAVAPTASKPPPLPARKPTSSPPPAPRVSTPPPVPKAAASKPPSNPPPPATKSAPSMPAAKVPPAAKSTPSMPATKVPSSSPRVASADAKGETRLRVCVRLSVRDGSLLVVRPLAEGENAPAGTREAYLVMADAEEVAVRRSAAR